MDLYVYVWIYACIMYDTSMDLCYYLKCISVQCSQKHWQLKGLDSLICLSKFLILLCPRMQLRHHNEILYWVKAWVYTISISWLSCIIMLHQKRHKCTRLHVINHGIWQYLEVSKEDKFPTLEACSNSQIHVLHCGSILPTSCFIERCDPPHTSSPCQMNPVSNGFKVAKIK